MTMAETEIKSIKTLWEATKCVTTLKLLDFSEKERNLLVRALQLPEVGKAKNKFLKTIKNREIREVVDMLITMRVEKWTMGKDNLTKLYNDNPDMNSTDVDAPKGYPWTIFYTEVYELLKKKERPFEWWPHDNFGDIWDQN